MSGIEVATPNTLGRIRPYGVLATIGINHPKKSTNMVGQKAMAKLAPMRKEPIFPAFTTGGNREDRRYKNFNLNRPISTRPVISMIGPIAWRKMGKY